MPTLHLIASRPLAGKTAVAAGLARGMAAKAPVNLIRAASASASGEAAAAADAITYAGFLFANSPGEPVAAGSIKAGAEGTVTLIEIEAGTEALAEMPALLVVRGKMSAEDAALGKALGDRLIGTIATNLPESQTEAVARDLTNAGLRPLALVPEDRALAAPCVAELQEILQASLLYEGENSLEVVEAVLVGPVFADPAQPHFQRFDSKAVLAPFQKTDLHLAAIETNATCLIITGGGQPSPYVIDRAQGEPTTVLLTENRTPATIAALSDVWLTSRFRGESKLEAIYGQLSARLDFASLLKKIGLSS